MVPNVLTSSEAGENGPGGARNLVSGRTAIAIWGGCRPRSTDGSRQPERQNAYFPLLIPMSFLR